MRITTKRTNQVQAVLLVGKTVNRRIGSGEAGAGSSTTQVGTESQAAAASVGPAQQLRGQRWQEGVTGGRPPSTCPAGCAQLPFEQQNNSAQAACNHAQLLITCNHSASFTTALWALWAVCGTYPNLGHPEARWAVMRTSVPTPQVIHIYCLHAVPD